MKRSFIVIASLVIVGAVVWIALRSAPQPVSNREVGKLRVVASFYPLADFAKNVGGDLVDVKNITPAGTEPHDFEPTPRDIASVYDANVFVLNGGGIDAWASKIADDVEVGGVAVLQMTRGAKGAMGDAHTWLDPVEAKKDVDALMATFAQADPKNAGEYRQRAEAYAERLSALDREYQAGLKDCQTRRFVVTHDAFAYLARRYGLTAISIVGLSPDEEPSPQRIAEVADTAKKENIRTIFFETLVPPKLAQTIAQEVGARTAVLNPIEGLTDDELKAGKDYISVMQENLVNLRTALVCR